MVNNFAKEIFKLWDWLVLLDVFVVDCAQANEELMETLHKFLSVVWESGHHAIANEEIRKSVLK